MSVTTQKKTCFFIWWSEVWKKKKNKNKRREVVSTFRVWNEIKEEEDDNVLILFKIAN